MYYLVGNKKYYIPDRIWKEAIEASKEYEKARIQQMSKKQEALEKIERLLNQANDLIRQAEVIADESKVEFAFKLSSYYKIVTYYAKGTEFWNWSEDSNEEQPEERTEGIWQSSSDRC